MDFPGFRDESFQFFAQLKDNNSHEWFRENRAQYKEFVLDPLRQLVRELGPVVTGLEPAFALAEDVDEHIAHLERGPRLPPGTPPYKTSLYCFFWDTNLQRLSDGNFYVGVNAEGCTIGYHIYRNQKDRRCHLNTIFLPRLRRHLDKLDEYIKASYMRRGFNFSRYAEAPGRLGIKPVEPFPEKAAEWENTIGWVATRTIAQGSSRLTPGSFVAEVKDSFEKLYPLYAFSADPSPGWRKRFVVE